ncbi:unnamed protein product [Parnassius apollo]|uniref:(apollo) hypothetical protein n=1 Tax=Parnassius apollo TaxID=110799 RepID=A0A8S3Y6M8_PARAO|nr:unnamed protein product [Parnassius apollo]
MSSVPGNVNRSEEQRKRPTLQNIATKEKPKEIHTRKSDVLEIAVTAMSKANRLYQDAKLQLEQSGNLKTSIKETVVNNLSELFGIVLQLNEERQTLLLQLEKARIQLKDDLLRQEKQYVESPRALMDQGSIRDIQSALTETVSDMRTLTDSLKHTMGNDTLLDKHTFMGKSEDTRRELMEIKEELSSLKDQMGGLRESLVISETNEPTYASIAGRPKAKINKMADKPKKTATGSTDKPPSIKRKTVTKAIKGSGQVHTDIDTKTAELPTQETQGEKVLNLLEIEEAEKLHHQTGWSAEKDEQGPQTSDLLHSSPNLDEATSSSPVLSRTGASLLRIRTQIKQARAAEAKEALKTLSETEDTAESDIDSGDTNTSLNTSTRSIGGNRMLLNDLPRHANEVLQRTKAELEKSGNLKREIRESVVSGMYTLYEMVLKLSDSRILHILESSKQKLNVSRESERLTQRHARFMHETLGQYANLKENVEKLLKETESTRSIVSYDLCEAVTATKKEIVNVRKEITLGSSISSQMQFLMEELKQLRANTDTLKNPTRQEIDLSRFAEELQELRQAVRELTKDRVIPQTQSSEHSPEIPNQEMLSEKHHKKFIEELQDHISEIKAQITAEVAELRHEILKITRDIKGITDASFNSQLPSVQANLEELRRETRELRDTTVDSAAPIRVAIESLRKELKNQPGVNEADFTGNNSQLKGDDINDYEKRDQATVFKHKSFTRTFSEVVMKPHYPVIVESADPRNTSDDIIKQRFTAAQNISRLAKDIITCIQNGKSVTAERKSSIINMANEIMQLSTRIEATSGSADCGEIQSILKGCIKEELAILKTELKQPSYAHIVKTTPAIQKAPEQRRTKHSLIVTAKTDTKKETVEAWQFDTAEQRDYVIKNINESESNVTVQAAKKLRPMIQLKGISKDVPVDELYTNRKECVNNFNFLNFVQCNLGRCKEAQHEFSLFLRENDIHVALINEPYLGETNLMKKVDGYTIYQFQSNRPVKACILIKENSFSTLGISEYSNSNCSIVRINKAGKQIYLISVYIEPRNDIYDTMNQLKLFLENTKEARHIIGGDFNGWHCLWNSKSNNRRDHNGIEFKLHLDDRSIKKNKRLSTFRYHTTRINWDNIEENFKKEINKALPTQENICKLDTVQLEKFIVNMTLAIQNACNVTLPRALSKKSQNPWWSTELENMKKELIKKHHTIHQLKRRSLPLTEAIDERNKLKAEYSEALKNASILNFKEFCNKQGKDDVWSLTNKLLKTKPLTQPPSTVKLRNGYYTVNTTEAANVFLNEYFPDDTPDVTEQQREARSLMEISPKTTPDPSFTTEEILDCLGTMNPNKSPGPDHLTNLELLQNKTNQALEMITQWGFNAKLTFGPQKTQAIAFTNKAEKCVLKINNQQVHFKNTIKLLGITIDKKLNFTQHVKSIIDKAQNIYQKLIRFVRPTWGIHGDNITIIYKQVIEPIICYASSIWHDAIKFECVRKKLLSLQRGFAIKIVRGFRTLSTAASISLANLTPLPAKILETAEIENTRITGISKFLPQDITLDGPVQPSTILHPANRVKINFNIASEQEHIVEHVPPGSYQIYTDGSKTDGNVGAAFVVYGPQQRKVVKKI